MHRRNIRKYKQRNKRYKKRKFMGKGFFTGYTNLLAKNN